MAASSAARDTATVALRVHPAPSDTTTVMLLLPTSSAMSAMAQAAAVLVPLKLALPAPPRSLDQVTSKMRMLSVAVPLKPMLGLVTSDKVGLMVRLGRARSKREKRTRSGCIIPDVSDV
jgi:hypothetical protein